MHNEVIVYNEVSHGNMNIDGVPNSFVIYTPLYRLLLFSAYEIFCLPNN